MIPKVEPVYKNYPNKNTKDDSKKKDSYFYKVLTEEVVSTNKIKKDTFSSA